MNSLIKSQFKIAGKKTVKTHKPFKWLTVSVAVALVPLYVLANCFKSYAELPESATIAELNPPILKRPGHESHPLPARIRDRLESYKDSILVNRSSWAHLQFRNRSRSVTPIVQVGPSDTLSEYLFPCEVRGDTTIGWGLINVESGCRFIRVESGGKGRVTQLPGSISTYIAQARQKQLALPSSNLLQYCSALENAGSGWGLGFSNNFSENPCQKALQECLESGSGNECSVETFGVEPADDRNLIASIQCLSIRGDRLVYTSRENRPIEDEVLRLKEDSKFLNRGACTLNVYRADELMISPTNDELTLVQTHDLGDGNLAIDALVGSVTIVSLKRPKGFNLPEGMRYQSGTDTLQGIDCPKRLISPSVQAFLNPNNWLSSSDPHGIGNIQTQLTGYRENFCQNSPRTDNPSFEIDIRLPICYYVEGQESSNYGGGWVCH
jgi:hypothetical protein